MSELFREIEEDIRQERMDKLWQGFGKLMIGVSVAVVLATVTMVIVQNYRQAKAMEKTTQMLKAIDQVGSGDFKGAIDILTTLTADENTPYYGVAMLRKAQIQAANNQPDEAKKTYAALGVHDDAFGSLAKMMSYGDAATGDIIAQPDKNAALYFTQSEFRSWQLLQQGKKTEAIDQFAVLEQDNSGPPSFRDRITEVLKHIAPEKLEDKPKDTPHEQ